MNLVELENINFAYPSSNELVLENVSLSVKSNDFLAIIGANGGGKTTLIKLILGLLSPKSGSITYNLSLKDIGYVPQITQNIAFPISVKDVIALGLLDKRGMFGLRLKRYQNALDSALNCLNIAHLAQKSFSDLSGGERQKVLIARALISNPKLLILDEPMANVDVSAQEAIYTLLKSLDCAIIMISHDIALCLKYATSVLYVNRSATPHSVPKLPHLAHDNHICEIDIFEYLAKHTSDSKALDSKKKDFALDSSKAKSSAKGKSKRGAK